MQAAEAASAVVPLPTRELAAADRRAAEAGQALAPAPAVNISQKPAGSLEIADGISTEVVWTTVDADASDGIVHPIVNREQVISRLQEVADEPEMKAKTSVFPHLPAQITCRCLTPGRMPAEALVRRRIHTQSALVLRSDSVASAGHRAS